MTMRMSRRRKASVRIRNPKNRWHRPGTGVCLSAGLLVSSGMADNLPMESLPLPLAQPQTLFKAFANTTRLTMLRRLAAGETLCVNDFAGITRRNQDAASRHLVILLRAGAVVPVPAPDGDGRKQFYAIRPGVLRPGPAGPELDFGSCVVRL